MEPNEDPDADWRLDTMVGSTCCVPLINGYLNADNDFMDDLHADGAVAGFFCYPLDTLREEEGSQKIFDFRDKLEEVFTTDEGSEVLTLTGGAPRPFFGLVGPSLLNNSPPPRIKGKSVCRFFFKKKKKRNQTQSSNRQ